MSQIKPGLPPDFEIEANHVPLYKRLPTHDENGRFLSDFMMLIPGLKNRTGQDFTRRLDAMYAVLGNHEDVVFADLNTPLNLLWVSVRTRHSVINDLVAELRLHIPEARLVGHPVFANPDATSARGTIETTR